MKTKLDLNAVSIKKQPSMAVRTDVKAGGAMRELGKAWGALVTWIHDGDVPTDFSSGGSGCCVRG